MILTLKDIASFPNSLDGIVDDINIMSSFLNKEIRTSLSDNFKRKRKLTPELVMYIISRVNGSSHSYNTILNEFKINGIVSVTEQSVNEKLQLIDNSNFDLLNRKLCEYIYSKKQNRYIAVDCVRINLYELFTEFGIPKSNNGGCCTAIVSALIDIDTNIPINYHIHMGQSERDAFREQVHHINPETDTLIFDKGYFGANFFNELTEKKINYVFSLQPHFLFLRNFKNDNNKNSDIAYVKIGKNKKRIRLIKYKIDNVLYLLGTSREDLSVDYLKNIYHKRWQIETQFNFIKNTMSFSNIKSRSLNRVKQDIYIHQFIMIICYYIQSLLYKKINYSTEKKINTTSMLNIVHDKILYILLNINKSASVQQNYISMSNCLNVVAKSTVCVVNNRHYDRQSKKPIKKFTVTVKNKKIKNKKKHKLNNIQEQQKKVFDNVICKYINVYEYNKNDNENNDDYCTLIFQ